MHFYFILFLDMSSLSIYSSCRRYAISMYVIIENSFYSVDPV